MKKTLLLAHRGFSARYPENSPCAFEAALDYPCDGFESDVHLSKDGKLVIFHDAVLTRTSNGTGYLKDYTYEELLQFDIGSWKGEEFRGQHLWTFEQLLDFCQAHQKVLNLELKNYEVFYAGLEEQVIAAIRAAKMEEQVFVSSFNHISMQRFKTLAPEIRTGLLYDKPLLNMERYITDSNADSMHPKYILLQNQPELVPLFRSRGMGINVWTVDQAADIREMLQLEVDCIISNKIDFLCETAAAFRP